MSNILTYSSLNAETASINTLNVSLANVSAGLNVANVSIAAINSTVYGASPPLYGNYCVYDVGAAYVLTSINDLGVQNGYGNIYSYTILGSNNGVNWSTIVTTNPSSTVSITTGSTTAYRYFAWSLQKTGLVGPFNTIQGLQFLQNGASFGNGVSPTPYGSGISWVPLGYANGMGISAGVGYSNGQTYTGSVNIANISSPDNVLANITALQLKTTFPSLNVTGNVTITGVETVNNNLNVYGPGGYDTTTMFLIQNNASQYGRNELKLVGRMEAGNDAWSFHGPRNAISFSNQPVLNGTVNRRYVIQCDGATNEIGILSAGRGNNPITTWADNGVMNVKYGANVSGSLNTAAIVSNGNISGASLTAGNSGLSVAGSSSLAGVSAAGISATSVASSGNVSGASVNVGASGLSVSGSSSLAGVSAAGISATSVTASGAVSGASLSAGASGLSVSGSSSLAGVSATSVTSSGAVSGASLTVSGTADVNTLNATAMTVTNETGISGQGVVDVNVTALGGANTYVNGAYSKVTIDSAFGGTGAADISTVQAARARVLGNNITNAGINISAIRADYRITGFNNAQMKTAVLASIQPGTNTADAAMIAYIEGDRGVSHAEAAYAVRMANSTAGSGFTYGLDLTMPNIINGPVGAPNVAFDTADVRLNNGLLIKSVSTAVSHNDTSALPIGTVVLTNNMTGAGLMFISNGSQLKQLAFLP